MSASARSEFVDSISPLHDRLKLYDPTKPPTDQPKNDAADPPKAVPQGFIDAMTVRHAVYVEEQKVPLENELDEDDARSYHWIAYASVAVKHASPDLAPQDEKMDNGKRRKSTSTKVPIGTIRLVLPPHPPHPNGKTDSDVQSGDESYVKLGRLAVIKEFRKAGISKLLIETALAFVREHAKEVQPDYDAGVMESMKYRGVSVDFKGLVLVHSQRAIQKVWKRYGFEKDDSMGAWDEEGIEHVGMWKRVDVTEGRRKSKAPVAGSP